MRVWILVFVVALLCLRPAAAQPAPAPGTAPADCAIITDLAERAACEARRAPVVGPLVTQATDTLSFASDPFAWMATKTNEAVSSTLRSLIDGMDTTTAVPLHDPAFLGAFAKSWGIATFLTMVLWLWAVGVRAARGTAPFSAVGEAFGYLVVSVLATSVVVPLVAMGLSLVDGLCEAVFTGFTDDMSRLLETVDASGAALSSPGGNPVLALLLGLVMLLALLVVWIELVVRSAMVLVGLLFAPLVFSGLVNRNLWGATRKWVGVMASVIASKYIVYAILTLGSSLLTAPAPDGVAAALQTELSAIVLFVVAVWSSASVARWVPLAGDNLHHALGQRNQLSPVVSGANSAGSSAAAGAGQLATAISTHRYAGLDGSSVVPVEHGGAGVAAGAGAAALAGARPARAAAASPADDPGNGRSPGTVPELAPPAREPNAAPVRSASSGLPSTEPVEARIPASTPGPAPALVGTREEPVIPVTMHPRNTHPPARDGGAP